MLTDSVVTSFDFSTQSVSGLMEKMTIVKRTRLTIRVKYIEVFAVTLDGLTGGKVKVLHFFLIMKSWDCQTSEALWEVTDMLVSAMNALENSAPGTS